LAESREAELVINRPCYEPRDCQVGSRMDRGGEHPGEWAGGHGCVMVTCHLFSCFDRAAAEQYRQHHQTRAVCRGYQKRPNRQVPEAHLHADPARVIMTYQGEDPQTEQDCSDGITDRVPRQGHPQNAAAITTLPIASEWPSAIGTSALATALAFRSCIPSATAKSHPIPGL